jgi:uncharacterized protein (DUF1684 family)
LSEGYTVDQLIAFRQAKDEFFQSSPQSPLSPEQQEHFGGLSYYEPDPALVFDLQPEQFGEKAHVKMQTSTGETRSYLRWGKVTFQVAGEEASLTLYFTPGTLEFFVPFTDATSGTETYGAGRYLELGRLPDGKVHLDFNMAYNPYCAYAPQWSCPIPPRENRLKVPIRAGEKNPVGEWVASEHE